MSEALYAKTIEALQGLGLVPYRGAAEDGKKVIHVGPLMPHHTVDEQNGLISRMTNSLQRLGSIRTSGAYSIGLKKLEGWIGVANELRICVHGTVLSAYFSRDRCAR